MDNGYSNLSDLQTSDCHDDGLSAWFHKIYESASRAVEAYKRERRELWMKRTFGRVLYVTWDARLTGGVN